MTWHSYWALYTWLMCSHWRSFLMHSYWFGRSLSVTTPIKKGYPKGWWGEPRGCLELESLELGRKNRKQIKSAWQPTCLPPGNCHATWRLHIAQKKKIHGADLQQKRKKEEGLVGTQLRGAGRRSGSWFHFTWENWRCSSFVPSSCCSWTFFLSAAPQDLFHDLLLPCDRGGEGEGKRIPILHHSQLGTSHVARCIMHSSARHTQPSASRTAHCITHSLVCHTQPGKLHIESYNHRIV